MISRVRLDGYGTSADYCSRVLNDHADLIEQMLGVSVSRGEEVIEKQLTEPVNSDFSYKGRLILYPDIMTKIMDAKPSAEVFKD